MRRRPPARVRRRTDRTVHQRLQPRRHRRTTSWVQHEPTSLPLIDAANKPGPPERPSWCQLCFRWIRHSRCHWKRDDHHAGANPVVRRHQGKNDECRQGKPQEARLLALPVLVRRQRRRQRLPGVRRRERDHERGTGLHRQHGRHLHQIHKGAVRAGSTEGGDTRRATDRMRATVPGVRTSMGIDGACDGAANSLARRFNGLLRREMAGAAVAASMPGMRYFIGSVYSVFTDMIANPRSVGLEEAASACCGGGRLNAEVGCSESSNLCADRGGYVFWDQVHGTQAAYQRAVLAILRRPTRHAEPARFEQSGARYLGAAVDLEHSLANRMAEI